MEMIVKKYLVIQFLMIAFLINANGQGNSFFSLKGGVSMPMGEYSSNNIDKGAFTTTGLSFGVDGAWYFYKNFGVGADVKLCIHSVDAAALATETFVAANNPLLNNLYVRSDPYKVVTGLIGIYYQYHVFNKWSIEPKILSGVMLAYTPFQLYEAEYFLLPSDYYKKTTSKDYNIAFKAGLSIRYDLNNCINLKLSGDYTTANMSFGFYNSSGKYYRDQRISYLDIHIGLVYNL